jgi:divalent metal cation (Fe/Co/Zn/Cd) transporter
VTLFILHVGYEVTGEILHHLMDGVDAEELETARLAASEIAGEGVTVRGRWMGRSLMLDVEIPADADARVSEIEAVGREVQSAIYDAVPAARQVTFRPRSSF